MSTLKPVGMDATTGQFKIARPEDLLNGAPVIGATPTVALGTAAGSGATVSIVGSNSAGKITLVSGTGILVTGTVMTLTLGNGFAFPSGCVIVFSAGNSAFASVLQYLSVSTGVTGGSLSISLNPLGTATTYVGYYKVEGW